MTGPAAAASQTATLMMTARTMRRPRASLDRSPATEKRPSRRIATRILAFWPVMHAFGKDIWQRLGCDRSPISAPNCLIPLNGPSATSPLIFAHDRFTKLDFAHEFDDCRDAHSALAGAVEPLAAPGIRHRRLSGALVRRLSGAEPLDDLWALPRRRLAARLLAQRHPASLGDGLDHRPVVADPSGPSDCAAGDRGGAGVDDGAAVADERSADRYFCRSRRAGVVRAGVARRSRVAIRALCTGVVHCLCGLDP